MSLGVRRQIVSVMAGVRKKLREARFFLGKMAERESLAFGDHEEFDFYLSAFLSAARSVDYKLRHHGATYKTFYAKWIATLSLDDQKLVKLLVDDRDLEVHNSGSTRVELETRIQVGDFYRDRSGTVTVASPPGTPPTEIIKPSYHFRLGDQTVPAVECCRKYINLLELMVEEYCRTHSIS